MDVALFCRDQYPKVFGALALYCGNPAVAEELAQDALGRAVARWDKVSRMDNPVGWLHRVAFNLAHSHFRRARAERKALQAAEVAGREPPPVDLVGSYELRAALESLPRRQRRAVVLRHYVGLSVEEVAEVMDCSGRTVKRLTSDALASMRRQLDPAVKTLEVSG